MKSMMINESTLEFLKEKAKTDIESDDEQIRCIAGGVKIALDCLDLWEDKEKSPDTDQSNQGVRKILTSAV